MSLVCRTHRLNVCSFVLSPLGSINLHKRARQGCGGEGGAGPAGPGGWESPTVPLPAGQARRPKSKSNVGFTRIYSFFLSFLPCRDHQSLFEENHRQLGSARTCLPEQRGMEYNWYFCVSTGPSATCVAGHLAGCFQLQQSEHRLGTEMDTNTACLKKIKK